MYIGKVKDKGWGGGGGGRLINQTMIFEVRDNAP